MVPVGLMLGGDIPLQEVGALARLLEHGGFTSLWHADEKFARDPFVALTVAALNSADLMLGTCVTEPYSRHPALLAMAVATLCEVARDRVIIGLGAGGGLRAIGITRRHPADALAEATSTIRSLLNGDQVSLPNGIFPTRGVRLSFSSPSLAPVYVAARGPRVLQVAGRVADGVIVAPCATPAGVRYAAEQIELGRRLRITHAKHVELVPKVDIGITEHGLELVREARERIALALVNSHPHLEFLEPLGVPLPSGEFQEALSQHGRHGLLSTPELIPTAYIDQLTIIGTLDEIAQRLIAIINAGATQVILDPMGTPDSQALEKFVKLVSEHIIPVMAGRTTRS